MRSRRVLLCLPETPSEDVLALAREVKAALQRTHHVRLKLADEDFDDDETPVEFPNKPALVLRIEEPSDDGERTM
jgi:hypothetical protein